MENQMSGWVFDFVLQGIIPIGWDENSKILDTTSILRSLININHSYQSFTITTINNASLITAITTITSITNAITTTTLA